jgi:hypothetical protein
MALVSTAMTAPLAAYFARRDGQPIVNPRLNDHTGVQFLV